MKVILVEDVKALGKKGEMVNVSWICKKYAVPEKTCTGSKCKEHQ